MNGPPEEGRQEIIIVRRGGHGDEEGHHGGVWKIAFADFMTAMMCFFLVMWLINASNEETRVSVASYFNPVKLTDRSPSQRGVDDVGSGPPTENSGKSPDTENTSDKAKTGPAENQDASTMKEVSEHNDKNLFADPYAVLAEIAQGTGTMQNVSNRGDGGAQLAGPASGASGGESYRDPFAPDFWSSQMEEPANLGDTTEQNFDEGAVVAEGDPEKAGSPPRASAVDDSDAISENPFAAPAPTPRPEPQESAAMDADNLAEMAAAGPAPAPAPGEEMADLAERLRAELARAVTEPRILEGLTVTPTRSGVTISIADDIQQGMFEIGSAVPRRDLVLAMEKIGRTLAAQDGKVTINGHTDGRPFSNADYDNWRLSTARAHSAYYMLIRGGLDERRVSAVAGYADRQLKVPADPLSSVNRRIEILLDRAG